MKKTILGVAMVVVFCITWWIVAGEAMQITQQAAQTAQQAEQTASQAKQAYQQAEQAEKQAYHSLKQAEQAEEQTRQAARSVVRAKLEAEDDVLMARPASGGGGGLGSNMGRKKAPNQSLKQAEQAAEQARQAAKPAEQAVEQARQAAQAEEQAWQEVSGARNRKEHVYEEAEQASNQAKQADIMADAHFRTQASWGIGAGLLADVLLLVGALAWSKLTAKT